MVVAWALFSREIRRFGLSVSGTLYNNGRKERSPFRELRNLEDNIREAMQRQSDFLGE